MTFLSSSTWWTIVVVAFFLSLVRELGMRGRGTLSPAIKQVGQLGLVLTVAVAVWLTGWQGGFGLALVSFLGAPLLAGIVLFPFMRAGNRVGLGDHLSAPPAWQSRNDTAIPTVDQLMARWDRDKREWADIADRQDIAAVLFNNNATASDIERIDGDIRQLRLGARTARKVVSDPKLLAEHLKLEAAGVTGDELVRLYLERFGPP